MSRHKCAKKSVSVRIRPERTGSACITGSPLLGEPKTKHEAPYAVILTAETKVL